VRLKAPLGILYAPADKTKPREAVNSLVRNISGGGVCFVAKKELRCGDLLKVQLQIPQLTEPIHTFGEVVWFSQATAKGETACEAGVCFRDLKPKDLHAILEYVHTVGIG